MTTRWRWCTIAYKLIFIYHVYLCLKQISGVQISYLYVLKCLSYFSVHVLSVASTQSRSGSGCHPVRYCYGVTPLPALSPPLTKCKKLMLRKCVYFEQKLTQTEKKNLSECSFSCFHGCERVNDFFKIKINIFCKIIDDRQHWQGRQPFLRRRP